MHHILRLRRAAALLASGICFAGSVSAQTIIYDNTANAKSQFLTFGNEVEYGDEIQFAGTARTLTDFSFQYYAAGALSGNETAQLFIRSMDGPLVMRPDGTTTSAPGSVLFTSDLANLSAGQGTIEFKGLSIDLPDRVTWTVNFTGLTQGEEAGLRISYPATVGMNAGYNWQKGTTWELRATPVGLAATALAVPEPGVLSLMAIGAGLFLRRRYVR